jgi:hypothetical protein
MVGVDSIQNYSLCISKIIHVAHSIVLTTHTMCASTHFKSSIDNIYTIFNYNTITIF